MRFSNLISQLSALAILLGTASAAVEIRFYWNTYTCSGDYSYWYNIPSNNCYSQGSSASHAVEFFNVPSGAKGQVYTDVPGGCSYWGGEGGSGTYCLNAHFFYSANWFYPSKRLAMRDESEDSPSSTGFQYTAADGTTRRIACAPEDFEKVAGLAKSGDYDALDTYPEGKGGVSR